MATITVIPSMLLSDAQLEIPSIAWNRTKGDKVKTIKMLGLAVVAVGAMSAFLGAGTASAHHLIGFCKANEPLLCEAGNLLGASTLKAHSGKAELKNNAFFSSPEVCESDVSVTASAVDANPIKGTIPKGGLTFTNCSGPCTSATPTNLPWEGELSMSVEGGTGYTLSTKKGGAVLTGCTFGTTCEYGVPSGGSVSLTGENSTEGGVFKANAVSLEYKSGSGSFVCGSTGTWTATYSASPAKSWWLTLLGA